MLSWLWALALGLLIGSVSARAWWIERKKRIIAERRVVERPNSFYGSMAVHNQEDEEWWRRIELERLLRQIEGAGVGTLTQEARAFMERMANLEAPPRRGARPPARPSAQPGVIDSGVRLPT